MVQKRAYDDEDVIGYSSFKQMRQEEHGKELVSFSESVFPEGASPAPSSLDGGLLNVGARVVEDSGCSGPGSFSMSSWPTSEEISFHGSLFPEFRSPERSARSLHVCDDIYNLVMNNPPRKTIPISSDHQAEVLPWVGPNTSYASSQSETEFQKRMTGRCIIPMPDLTLEVEFGRGRTDCNCEDALSTRCVRKHIKEARAELARTVGTERFGQLGFYDMGEEVARYWSEEEEHAFHQVIFSNSALVGKNFWEKLSSVFPFRTKKEIVSYYFNVFMLRKRADQNRYDPTNIDSDNDEWPGGEEFGDNELGTEEEDEDSVIESPNYDDDRNREDHHCDRHDIPDNTNTPKHPEKTDMFCSDHGDNGDQEVQDDSCTSFDAGVASQRNPGSNFHGSHSPSSFNGLITGGSNGYVLEPCYSKDWEVGFTGCSRNEVDFLPTCNMIEEVFGEEMRSYGSRDGKNSN